MDDIEMLGVAAKAASYQIEWVKNSGCYYRCEEEIGREQWDPLDDDGDCARLEVACELQIDIGDLGVISERADGIECFERYEDHAFDRNATRRRASVRAAAEIGKTM